MSDKPSLTYADAGVNIDAGNAFVQRIKRAAASTARPEVLGGLGGFGAFFAADFHGMREPVLVSSTDGVGTKLLLLQKHGRPNVAGMDVVAMCVNDLAAQAAEPLFFLDYLAAGSLEEDVLAAVVEGVAEACRVCGCALIGGETAEMPGMYAPGHYDIAGFSVGVVERRRLVNGSAIRKGDVLLGLAASGPHANGFSLIRKLIEIGGTDIERDGLADGTRAVDALLAPTRLYVPAVQALNRAGVEIHGFAHITGGGMFDNLERILPSGLSARVSTSSWPVPPVFDYLFSLAEVERDERYRTFNMGIGFVVILPESEVDKAEKALIEAGETIWHIGRIHARRKEAVVLDAED